MRMLAAVVVEGGGVALREVEAPRPLPTQILVKVAASALNRADLGVVAGARHGSLGGPGTIPGLEWSGEVVEAGQEAKGFSPGDRVMCSGTGAYAQYAVVDWRRAMRVPAGADLVDAAALPVALQTMHDAVVTNGRLAPGESVLVQGASSGVGLMALQIARFKGAATIIGSSGDPGRRARLAEFGATHVVDPRDPAWPEAARAATGGAGVRLIVDQVSGPDFNRNLDAVAIKGRIVNVGRLGGMTGPFDFDLHALKRVDYVGVTFRTRSVEEIAAINALMLDDLGEAVASGALRMPVDSRFPLARVNEALDRMRANAHFGKILLTAE